MKSFAIAVSAAVTMAFQGPAEVVDYSAEEFFGTSAIEEMANSPGSYVVNDHSKISNKRMDWYFKRNKTHTPPEAQQEIELSKYNSYYLGDTSQKEIYLTFDSGYENGYTEKVLDILKEKEVPAAFFVLKSYMTKNPDLIKRMAEEGHIVANHSASHKNFSDLTGEEIADELKQTADYYNEITGKAMPKYFRPPSGVYSERALAHISDCGYKTVFWSFAYKDWEENNQPGRDTAFKMMTENTHSGSIMMLHSVSESNYEALADAIDAIRAEGYTFKSLDELP